MKKNLAWILGTAATIGGIWFLWTQVKPKKKMVTSTAAPAVTVSQPDTK